MWGYGREIFLLKDNVGVVIPALNEPYLEVLKQKLEGYGLCVRSEKGLSFAVWKGIQEAKGNIIVIMDADGSHDPRAIKGMLKLLDNNVWLVVGSRYVSGGYTYDSFLRKVISLFYCKIAQIVLRSKVRDCMSGFWCGYKWAFSFKPSQTYKFGLELIRTYKNHIKEYPIIFCKRKKGKSHVKFMQAIKDFLAIFRR